MNLEGNILRNAPLIHTQMRGTGDIIEESSTGMFLYDRMGETYTLITDEAEEGISWLKAHEDLDFQLITLYDDELIDFAKTRYGFNIEERCYQGVWTKAQPPKRKGIIDIRPADESHLDFILENYDHGNEHWIREVIEKKLIYIGEKDDEIVGFMGNHLEGALGMLYILPEYRRMGCAWEFESYMVEKTMNEGLLPYGHVIVGNEKSMALQKKIGFDFWEGNLSWLFKNRHEL